MRMDSAAVDHQSNISLRKFELTGGIFATGPCGGTEIMVRISEMFELAEFKLSSSRKHKTFLRQSLRT